MTKLALLGGTPVRAGKPPIPTWPIFDESDVQMVAEAVRGGVWGGFPEPGRYASQLAAEMARIHTAKHAICMANGTITLMIALQAAGVGWGDEVIIPGYTFAATGWAPLAVGAIPVFVDIDPQTYCISPAAIEAAITPRTRAIIPVHVGCCLADMDAIMQISYRHNLIVVEDAAHAHSAKWNNRGAGSLGHFGSFSLQSTKTLTTGEGGILLTNDDALAEACHSLIDCGRPKDPRGTRFRFGANFRMGELQCALGVAQIRRLETQTQVRAENMAYLGEALSEIPGVHPLQPYPQTTVRPTYRYIFKIEPEAFAGITNARFCEALTAEGIHAWRGWDPMYHYDLFRPTPETSPVVRNFPDHFRFEHMHLPEIERASTREAVWLDMEYFLGDHALMDDIVEAVHKIQVHAHELSA
ncbi:MAG: DegT/DnrJ/EryC1/StrS family aminotransferase [Candidatus Brachytrichaceae bacterium NZ_4S206]|jgi:dTDP-4-amino-4,6-dideoxygalactose transaminase